MRIIAGEKRGTKLFPPEDSKIRPTSDRVKESLFGILQFKLLDAYVLDICSGTGNIGLEALSRGAKEATFIDYDDRSIDLLKKNIDKLKFNERCVVFSKDALSALNELTKTDKQYDFIFFDPPYSNLKLYKNVIGFVLNKNLLKQHGALVVEHDEKYLENNEFECRMYDRRKYGSTYITFYR